MTAESERESSRIPTQRDGDVVQRIQEGSTTPSSGLDLQHAATIGAVGLALFTLLKAYAAAKFSLTTASALLTTAPLNVLLGTLVSYSYQIFPLLSIAAFAWLWHDYRRTQVWSAASWIALLVAFLALLVSPWRNLLLSIVAFVSLALLSSLGRWLVDRRGKHQAGRGRELIRTLTTVRMWVVLFFLAASVFVVIRTLTNVWLPVEVVIYQQGAECNATIRRVVRASDKKQLTAAAADGCRMTVGHVLDDEGDWTTVVRADDRGLLRLRSQDLRYRELCHLTGVQPRGERPLLWVFIRQQYRSPNTSCAILTQNIQGAELDLGSLSS